MRIGYVADAANVHTQRWASYFAGRGDQVHVVSFRAATIPGVTVHHVDPRVGKAGYVVAAPAVRRLVRAIRPDLLHAHHATSYGLVAALADVHPLVVTPWGSDVLVSARRSVAYRRMVQYVLARADAITATGDALAQATTALAPAGATVHVIPFGVDLEAFSPAADTPAHPPTVGIVKTLRPVYGVRELLLAFARVAHTRADVRLVVAGGGEQAAELAGLAARLGIADRASFLGPVAHRDVPDLLRSMDVFVVPSLSESFGVAAVEASACEVPVVASRVGGLPEVVRHDETGLLVTAGDVAQLAEAIGALLDDPERARAMGRAGRAFVSTRYRWQDNAAEMARLYESLLHRPPA